VDCPGAHKNDAIPLEQRRPPTCCGTAEAKPERKARWARAAGLRGLGRHGRMRFEQLRWRRASARVLHDPLDCRNDLNPLTSRPEHPE
jgi:hypothetical protein